MRRATPLLALASVLALAGCGHGGQRSAAPRRASERPCRHFGPAQQRAKAKLERDVLALRRAADTPTHDTFKGNAAVNKATDRFLYDQGTAPLDNFTRNRYINLAAAAVTPACSQCFQALEANRPIVKQSLSEPGALPCPRRGP